MKQLAREGKEIPVTIRIPIDLNTKFIEFYEQDDYPSPQQAVAALLRVGLEMTGSKLGQLMRARQRILLWELRTWLFNKTKEFTLDIEADLEAALKEDTSELDLLRAELEQYAAESPEYQNLMFTTEAAP